MADPTRTALRALGMGSGLAALALGLILSSSPASGAASVPAVARDHVAFAMRGPLKTGASQRLVFSVRGANGVRPTVLVHLTMPAMPMDERTYVAHPISHDRYAVRAPLTMPGKWLAHVTLESGGQSVTRVLPFRTIYGQPTPWRLLAVLAGGFLALVAIVAFALRRRGPDVASSERHA